MGEGDVVRLRKTNFEVLRILSILMIIAFHCVHYSELGMEVRLVNRVILDLVKHGGELGVCCFMLTSGWFLPETKFRWSKFFQIFGAAVFYKAAEMAVLAARGTEVEWTLKALIPIANKQYWFVIAFLYVYLLVPALGKMLPVLSQKELGVLLFSQIALWCFVPSLLLGPVMGFASTEDMPYYNRFIWMLVVYVEGYYLRRYGLPLKRQGLLLSTLAAFGLTALYVIAKDCGVLTAGRAMSATYFWRANTVMMLFMSTGLFLLFAGWEGPGRGGRVLTQIASCSLGIYLFHDGPLRPVFWGEIFPYIPGQNPLFVAGHLLVVVVAIYTAGLAIELLRLEAEDRVTALLRGKE